MKNKNIVEMTKIAIVTAILCILAPISIPIGVVPISLTNLVLYLGVYALGMKKSLISYGVYLVLAFIGLPVLAGYSGGPAKVFGPTGGYLFGFIFICIIGGMIIDRNYKNKRANILGLIVAAVICYVFGTVWLKISTGMEIQAAFMAGVIPFIPGDLVKIIVSVFVGEKIRDGLIQNKLFSIERAYR